MSVPSDEQMIDTVDKLIKALEPESDGSGPGYNHTLVIRRGCIPRLLEDLKQLKLASQWANYN